MADSSEMERSYGQKTVFDTRIDYEPGLTYRLDLQAGSEMYASLPNHRSQKLPVCPHGYGYFVAGKDHFTNRDGTAGIGLYQVFITYRGSGRFLVDGKEIITTPNTMLLLRCEKPHIYETAGEIWEHEWVNFTGLCAQVYYDMINPEGEVVYDLGTNHEIPTLLREAANAMPRQDLVSYVHTSTKIIQMLDAIYGFTAEQKHIQMSDRRGNVERSVRYIEEHYMEKISLDQLAQVAYLSKFYYTRAFSKYVGLTPYEYLNAVRISKAMSLLIMTNLSIDEIGWKVGFQGSRNMIRQFKKTMGITPGEYRKDTSAWWHKGIGQNAIMPEMKEILKEKQ